MKKILGILIGFLAVQCFASPARADDLCDISATNITSGEKTTVTVTNKTDQEETYVIAINPARGFVGTDIQRICNVKVPAHSTISVVSPKGILEAGEAGVAAWKQNFSRELICQRGVETVLRCSSDFTISRGALSTYCKVTATDIHPGEATQIKVENLSDKTLDVQAIVSGPGVPGSTPFRKKIAKGEVWDFQHTLSPGGAGPYKGKVEVFEASLNLICNTTFYIATNLEDIEKLKQTLEGFKPEECTATQEYIDERGWHPGSKGIQTALGCIPTEIQPFVSWLFKYAISIAGGIAFLMIIFASFQMITSSGDPEKLNKAKQMLGSAVAGLLFIAFAVFLLRVIGVDILKIF